MGRKASLYLHPPNHGAPKPTRHVSSMVRVACSHGNGQARSIGFNSRWVCPLWTHSKNGTQWIYSCRVICTSLELNIKHITHWWTRLKTCIGDIFLCSNVDFSMVPLWFPLIKIIAHWHLFPYCYLYQVHLPTVHMFTFVYIISKMFFPFPSIHSIYFSNILQPTVLFEQRSPSTWGIHHNISEIRLCSYVDGKNMRHFSSQANPFRLAPSLARPTATRTPCLTPTNILIFPGLSRTYPTLIDAVRVYEWRGLVGGGVDGGDGEWSSYRT